MGDVVGHEFHGNQWTEGTPKQKAAVEEAHRELSASSSDISQYLAKHGQAFFPGGGPGVPTGQAHRCYANAMRAAREDPRLTYVEGVAVANTGYRGSLELTRHAWTVDREGHVADPTPTNYHIVAYLGVKIPTGELPRTVERDVSPLAARVAWLKNPPKKLS